MSLLSWNYSPKLHANTRIEFPLLLKLSLVQHKKLICVLTLQKNELWTNCETIWTRTRFNFSVPWELSVLLFNKQASERKGDWSSKLWLYQKDWENASNSEHLNLLHLSIIWRYICCKMCSLIVQILFPSIMCEWQSTWVYHIFER